MQILLYSLLLILLYIFHTSQFIDQLSRVGADTDIKYQQQNTFTLISFNLDHSEIHSLI